MTNADLLSTRRKGLQEWINTSAIVSEKLSL
jgi:hypothetical protein